MTSFFVLTPAIAALIGLAAQAMSPATRAEPPPAREVTHGRVVHVDDGDTVVLLAPGNHQIKVRLASIDAPESSHTNRKRGRVGQPHANNAKRFLAHLVHGAEVQTQCFESDRYGRAVCNLFEQGRSVNAEMVRAGFAWANTSNNSRYLRDRELLELQRQAQAARAGLWRDASPVPPWEWRRLCWKEGQCGQRSGTN